MVRDSVQRDRQYSRGRGSVEDFSYWPVIAMTGQYRIPARYARRHCPALGCCLVELPVVWGCALDEQLVVSSGLPEIGDTRDLGRQLPFGLPKTVRPGYFLGNHLEVIDFTDAPGMNDPV
ncbi:hypothetical protein QN239_02650 [Mycolicibacterium sp. Y3]